MRVKRLEVQGFKSFKDKTVIHFDHSITGIVGPNGCGKSNIVDAFFWVMGEQSYKHMRGTGSEDLIFNGSSKYTPLGFAEATLVMETDVPDTENAPSGATVRDIPIHLRAKEISVTRRVYRSGEGEYFINGVSARLKDIQELFMDTGVGAKGYSIIEQGQIGKIVNSKPEERRLLIEEAAGIAKYKARKKESLRKMEAAQGNLSRLTDVIQEIERGLSSLERQAQKARLWRRYKDELLDKEMTWGRRRTAVLRAKLAEIAGQRDTAEQELIGLRAELQTCETSIEADRIEQTIRTREAEDRQNEIQRFSSELTQAKSLLDLSRKRQGDLEAQLQTLSSERASLESAIAEERVRISERETTCAEADAEMERAGAETRERAERASSLRTESDAARSALEAARKELVTGVAQSSDLASKAAALASRSDGARAQAEKLALQTAAQAEKSEGAKTESARAREAADAVRGKRETAAASRRERQAALQAAEQARMRLERERESSAARVTQIQSKLQSLEELAAAYEGFGDGTRAALEWAREAGNGDGLRALADAMDISAGYESAVEGWLESRIEGLVAENPAIAVEAMAEIRDKKQGRASVYVGCADSLQNAEPAVIRGVLEEAGFEVLGSLADFVAISDRAGTLGADVARRVLHDVCVVRSFEPMAKFIAADGLLRLGGWSIVSLEGSALDSSGVLRGGSREAIQSASVLGRRRAIEDLKLQQEDAEQALRVAQAALNEASAALESERDAGARLQTEIQALEVESAAIERDVAQAARGEREAESQLRAAELEREQMSDEAEKTLAASRAAEEGISAILARRAELEAQVAAGEAELTSREDAARAEESLLNEIRVREASMRERSLSLRRELESARALVTDRERRLSDVIRVLERASGEREKHSGGDLELETRISELTQTLGRAQDALAATKDVLEQCSAKINGALDRIKALHHDGDEKTAGSNQLALEIEKQSGELSHLIQNLEEKYGPGCLERPVTSPIQEEMTEPVVTAEMTAEEEVLLGEEVERLRERIRRLGEVNTMAIEEYEELKGRYDHLVSERADLERSIENLNDAIDHINKTSEERFQKAFEAIANRFEKLFPIIFGGGQAKLSLVYPENSTDLLEAGVDILAQPPGKKIVNIGLLSGGEKALTAVSLIFAIFMVKPSPFCVLDEVDAPLDDANIGKFNALLREMSAKSQFILITHNKKTMELNDTLYGVTMEEPGVSKMISIEMR